MYTPIESVSVLLKQALPSYFVSVFLSYPQAKNNEGILSRLRDILNAK